MKPVRFILSILVIFTAACNSAPKQPAASNIAVGNSVTPAQPIVVNNTTKQASEADNAIEDAEWQERYVLITDTGSNYHALRNKMQQLSDSTHLQIDSMGRAYNSKKDLIALPDDADDDIYAGDYFPRRDESTNLSIEYLDLYKNDAKPKIMAIVAGIYESRAGADSVYNLLGKHDGAFVTKARLYMGCMH